MWTRHGSPAGAADESAEDADSEGVEGKFYLWTLDDIRQALGDSEAGLFERVYNLKAGGNFLNPHTPPRTNIPHLVKAVSEYAAELDVTPAELERRLEAARSKLFEVRRKRIHPHKDDKILTDWNGG